MSLLLNGTSQYLWIASALLSSVPGTLACWFKTGSTAKQDLVTISSSSTTSPAFGLGVSLSTTSRLGGLFKGDSSASHLAEATTGYSTDVWCHGVIVATGTDVIAYLNGGSKKDVAGTNGTVTLNRTGIGVDVTTSALNFFSGRIAHVAIWSSALADADAANLAAGMLPSLVSPSTLLAYLALTGNFSDTKGNTWTAVASPTIDADNPTMLGGILVASGMTGGMRDMTGGMHG